ncbi:MAG: PAP/fibrillin family protein [Cyanobacteriota bacterium]|nr:PAP/fibrillin family protein [Cyanobacteriota bacterium]
MTHPRNVSAADQRHRLVELLRQEPRGSAARDEPQLKALVEALEHSRPADLGTPEALRQLEGVWELRWSSSRQPYLAVGPWLENLQLLAPSQGRGMNLLRVPGALGSIAAIAVEAAITLEATSPQEISAPRQQRVQVRFQRGGWLGPVLGAGRLQWMRRVEQSFPAWLDITVLDDELRICRGNAGTLFALLRRQDLCLEDLLLPQTSQAS